MGIIKKETFKGSTWSYAGAILGFVNIGLIFPKIFSTSQIGLLSVLVAISALFAQFSSLGMNSVTGRLFPYFKTNNEDKFSFFTLLIGVTLTGYVISLMIGLVFNDWIIDTQNNDSSLLHSYSIYLIPLTFFILMFNAFDNYNKMLYDITSGIFLKEFLLRALIFISVILFILNIINFEVFVLLYIASYLIPLLGLLLILFMRKNIAFRWNPTLFSPKMKREIAMVAAFGILAGFSGILIEQIDKYFVGRYLGLSEAGIYTIAFYIGTMILIPSRALNKISSTLIAESWKDNDLETIKDIYRKSSISQYVFGLFLFIVILANLHNIFTFLPHEFLSGRWVIIIFGFTSLVIMISGVSYSIISTAKYYWYMTALMIVQIATIVSANVILIPIWGINGAAIATLISVAIIRLGSIIVIGYKSKIWPFQTQHISATAIAAIVFLITLFIPDYPNIYFDSIVKSFIIFVSYISLIWIFNVSDFRAVLNSIAYKILKKKQ